MKRMRIVVLASLVAVAGCIPQPAAPPPQPRPQPAPPPAPPAPTAQDWRDMPLTPGGWTYSNGAGGSEARFGTAESGAQFAVRCDRARAMVVLTRPGPAAGSAMTIRTSFAARSLPAAASASPMPTVAASLAASDPLLDSMAFSRGRFTVEVPGAAMLVIPAWPEPARVVEDCRS